MPTNTYIAFQPFVRGTSWSTEQIKAQYPSAWIINNLDNPVVKKLQLLNTYMCIYTHTTFIHYSLCPLFSCPHNQVSLFLSPKYSQKDIMLPDVGMVKMYPECLELWECWPHSCCMERHPSLFLEPSASHFFMQAHAFFRDTLHHLYNSICICEKHFYYLIHSITLHCLQSISLLHDQVPQTEAANQGKCN